MGQNFIGFVVGRGVDKEVYRGEAESLGLSLSAYIAAMLPLDATGSLPVVTPRRLTEESVYIASDRADFLGTLASALRGSLDGRAPDRLPVGAPPPVVIAPKDAAKAILSRVLSGALALGAEQLAILEALRAPANN